MRVLLFFVATLAMAQRLPVTFDDSPADRMALGNDHYELVLSKANGAVIGLTDRASGAALTMGSRNGCLWGSSYGSDYVGGCSFRAGTRNSFSYQWSARDSTLTLTYTFDPAAARRVNATVEIRASAEPYFDMQLAVENQFGASMTQALFPSEWLFQDAAAQAGYLPFQLPGVRLRPSFFTGNRSRTATYPSLFAFADFFALDIAGGSLAVYTINPDGPIQPVTLGFVDDDAKNPGTFFGYHAMQTAVASGAAFTSPVVRVRVGQTTREAILGYRDENGIADYPSISDKLGDRFDTVAHAPLVKADWRIFLKKPFQDAIADLDRISAPAILHPVAYQPGGHDHSDPDFLPPEARWGTTADFADWTRAAQARGLIVMPYTNPSWWVPDSPTLQNLPPPLGIPDIAAIDAAGKPVFEEYPSGSEKNGGYAVSPYAPFVQNRIASLMAQWQSDVPVDFVFWDQTGARSWLRDFNPASPTPLSYSDGWQALWETFAPQGLMTEDGWDRLAAQGIGFCGSPLTGTTSFDIAKQQYGIGGNAHKLLGAENWDPYPLATWLMHDKVFFYHHDLEHPLTTEHTEVITWNLAFGNMMYYLWPGTPLTTPARMELAYVLQRTLAARYAGRALDDYGYLAPDVTYSAWDGGLSVIANWQQTSPYPWAGAIVPGGYVAWTDDGSVLAGAFQDEFAGAPLAPGEHHMIIERTGGVIVLRHPVGADTSIRVTLPENWSVSGVLIRALDRAGNVLLTKVVEGNVTQVDVDYHAAIDGAAVDHYEIAPQPMDRNAGR